MRVAIIADIHGNFVALRTVLEELERKDVASIVCLGDVAEAGPQPAEAIECLRSLDCPIVLGNTDAHLASRRALGESAEDPMGRLTDIDRWTIRQLTDQQLDFLDSLPETLTVDLDGQGAMLCYHGSPRSYDDRIEPRTSDADLAAMFSDKLELVMAGGHTHHQMLRRWGRSVLVNPGSVGLALTRPNAGPVYSQLLDEAAALAPYAEYAILSVDGRRLDVDLCRTAFDLDEMLAAASAAGMPQLDWWASKWMRR